MNKLYFKLIVMYHLAPKFVNNSKLKKQRLLLGIVNMISYIKIYYLLRVVFFRTKIAQENFIGCSE